MTLPDGFQFNQGNLQDYIDCQRRFQLRYMLHLAWPAVEAEPFLHFERISEQGSQFHKIVRQQLSGVHESLIDLSLGDDVILQLWWMNYQRSLNDGILQLINQEGNKLFAEHILSIPINNFRLIAKFDLLVFQPDGKFIIIDWKTSKNRPKHKWLENRLQSHVYPFVFTLAAASITTNKQIDPEQVEMIYWFTNQPDKPERFYYNSSAYKSDTGYLSNLTSEINQKTDPVFPLTSDVKQCQFCTYRSLCNRGVKPGVLQQLEDWQMSGQSAEDISLDYDQIIEMEF